MKKLAIASQFVIATLWRWSLRARLAGLAIIRFVPCSIPIARSREGALFLSVVMAMLAFVKPAHNKCYGGSLRETAPAVTPEDLRRAMLKFVEALAIAYTRRDHLIAVGVSTDRNAAMDADHCKKKASDT